MAGDAKDRYEPKTYQIIYEIWCDLCNGLTKYEILQKIYNDSYSLPTSHYKKSWRYKVIGAAFDEMKCELKENRDKQRELFYTRMTALYNDALQHNDRPTALGALKELGKFAGVYEPDKIEVKGNLTIDFGFDED